MQGQDQEAVRDRRQVSWIKEGGDVVGVSMFCFLCVPFFCFYFVILSPIFDVLVDSELDVVHIDFDQRCFLEPF